MIEIGIWNIRLSREEEEKKGREQRAKEKECNIDE